MVHPVVPDAEVSVGAAGGWAVLTDVHSARAWRPGHREPGRCGTAARARAGFRKGAARRRTARAKAISSSSTTPRFRYCWITSAPPATAKPSALNEMLDAMSAKVIVKTYDEKHDE